MGLIVYRCLPLLSPKVFRQFLKAVLRRFRSQPQSSRSAGAVPGAGERGVTAGSNVAIDQPFIKALMNHRSGDCMKCTY